MSGKFYMPLRRSSKSFFERFAINMPLLMEFTINIFSIFESRRDDMFIEHNDKNKIEFRRNDM